ncbi:MAG: excisionase [Oscillospiraceae bacterium]|nr:excisionase [Oscillospiraceae bacterium]
MKYTLMQKNYRVMELEISNDGTIITAGEKIYDKKRIPVGVMSKSDLNHWWTRRSIPASRSGIEKAMRVLNIKMPQELLTKCFGLSLSDQYWVKPEGMKETWEDINFFDNEFSDDIGNILFGSKPKSESLNMMSPDCTADGYLKKKWKIVDGERCLVKGGANFFQEPFNEVIAGIIAEAMKISHVEYRLSFEGKNHMPVCVCADFITRDTELVTASAINRVLEYEDGESKYDHFVKCCEFLKIPDCYKSLDEMLTLDYIIANQDRHMGNFGALRNADTLEYIGFAPIFDCGTSLRYDTPAVYIEADINVESQPFESYHDEQIKLVKCPERFDLTVLDNVTEKIKELFKDERASAYVDESRCRKIIEVLEHRIKKLEIAFTHDLNMAEEMDFEMKME